MKEIKKKLADDWERSIPELTKYASNKCFKRIGPLVVGIELTNLPKTEEYRPHFVCYPLWKSDLKSCFDKPIVLSQFYKKKHTQISIPYLQHDELLVESAKLVKKQVPITFDSDVSIKKVFSMINDFSKKPPLNASSNSYLQAMLCEALVELAVIMDEKNLYYREIDKIKRINWDKEHFKLWEIKVDDWIESQGQKWNKQQEYKDKVLLNRNDKMIQKLKSSQLLLKSSNSLFSW